MSDEWVMVPREPTEAMFSASSFQEWDTFEQEWRAMLYAAPAAPQQAEPTTNDRVNLAYKNGYEECLNDCIRNGGEAWARSMFADGGEHIKSQEQAEPVVYRKYLDGVDAHVYRLVPRDDEADKWEPLYLHPPAAEVQRLREALEYLIEKCGDSDDAQYGTLGTKFVRDIARRALEGK